MLTILIAVVVGALAGIASSYDLSLGWCIFNGIVVALAVQLLIGFYLRKKITALNMKIQEIITAGQTRINRQAQLMQRRPQTSIKAAQMLLEKEMEKSIRSALDSLKLFQPYYHWNLMLQRQINTMKMMFHYQLKDFTEVDRLMPKCMIIDPRAAAMKAARMYKNGTPELEKYLSAKAKKTKGEECVILYSLLSWIHVKRDAPEKALEALVAAKKKTDNPVIVKNWELLSNGKQKHFSNAELSDEWYSLHLEEPRIKPQKMRRAF